MPHLNAILVAPTILFMPSAFIIVIPVQRKNPRLIRPDYSKVWTETALFDLFQDGGAKKKQRCTSEQGREEYSESSNNIQRSH